MGTTCIGEGITVQDMKEVQRSEGLSRSAATSSKRKHYAHNVYDRVLPARGKKWAALTDAQRRAAEKLGVRAERDWDDRSAQVWHSSWRDLEDHQREAARALGMDELSW